MGGTVASKRLVKPQRQRRYGGARWAGLGLLTALFLTLGIEEFTNGSGSPSQSIDGPNTPPTREPLQAGKGSSTSTRRESAREQPKLTERGPRAAIIIDDLGNSWYQARSVTSLSYPVAVSILPETPFAERTARRAHAQGKEVLLHMPMEPSDSSISLGPTFLRTDMDRSELMALLGSNLGAIPYVQGVNNHMGSQLTSQTQPMSWVMKTLDRRDLFFVDSRTTARSQALAQARTQGVPATERDIFLDHRPHRKAIRTQFLKLLAEARQRGTAVAIGHPHPATLAILQQWLPKASSRGVEIVPVQEVLAVRALQRPGSIDLAYREGKLVEGDKP